VVIYDKHGDKPGDAIGTAAVKAGENTDLIVVVNRNHMSADLYARLHVDAGEQGKPEIPSKDNPNAPDVPLAIDGQEVVATFQHIGLVAAEGTAAASTTEEGTAVAGGAGTSSTEAVAGHEGTQGHSGTTPAAGETPIPFPSGMATVIPKEGVNPIIQVSDQEIQDGAIHIDNVVSIGQGWVVIWTLPENGASEAIGYAPVKDGDNPNVSVPVEAAKASPQMLAILHLDAGQQGVYEQQVDLPVHVGIQMIQTAFNLTGTQTAQSTEPAELPLIVVAEDQPVRGGNTVIIAEVVSDGPGWVGIHLTEPNGEMSHTAAIGAGQLHDGLNTNVVVRLNNPARATEKLWGMLHYDRDPIGDYNYPNEPGNDVPAKVNGQDVVDDFLVTGGLNGQKVVINVGNASGTPVLVDGQGFSLYFPSFDDCTDDQCLKEWRPLVATGGTVPGTGVTGLVSVRGLGDGTRQITYNGLPLYYYIGDFKPGDTNGYLQEDGRWVLATP
jgi:predicted lipoprotein with Yx(FWY)xxD motif